MCKAKDVHCVNRMMSARAVAADGRWRIGALYLPALIDGYEQKQLDKFQECNIIVLTACHVRPATAQTIASARQSHAQSATRGRQTLGVSGQRVLRCRRFIASEIRDVAARRDRQTARQPGGQGIRDVSPLLLSSTGRVSGSRARRAVAAQTRAPIRSQADTGTDDVRRATSSSRAGHLQCAIGRSDPRTACHFRSSAQYRPSAPASKKTPLSAETVSPASTDHWFVAAYEDLRRQAVEGWRQGLGFGILVSRGLRCWMEVCGQLLDTRSQTPPHSETALPPTVRNEVVILLAGILLHRARKVIA